MIKNYFKIAYRNLVRNKGYAAINILGLAVGMAVCLLISLYVSHELGYDRFHEKAERVYQVTSRFAIGDRARISPYMSAFMGPTLVEDVPGVKRAVRFDKEDEALVSRPSAGGRITFYEEGFLFADSTFFEVFSFGLLRGNPETALVRPYTLVLTESMAKKYFGSESPIGQSLTYNNEVTFTVTGVVADPPSNSSIRFDFLASLATAVSVVIL